MGRLLYANDLAGIEIDDRALAHVKQVVVSKLRLNHSFSFSMDPGWHPGHERCCLWLNPAIPLRFVFDDDAGPVINRVWIEQLTLSANSPTGLLLTPEPTS